MLNQSSVKSVGYAKGRQIVSVDDDTCVAKQIDGENHTVYLIKQGTRGAETGLLYNHMSPTFEERTQNRLHSETGRRQFEFVKVKKEVFDLYLQFLESGNLIYLRKAERERA